ncbi:MAG: hypothetical protein ABI134_10695, partial [Byssovorax sp.]
MPDRLTRGVMPEGVPEAVGAGNEPVAFPVALKSTGTVVNPASEASTLGGGSSSGSSGVCHALSVPSGLTVQSEPHG